MLIEDIPKAFASEFSSLLSKAASWKEVSQSSVIPYSFMSSSLELLILCACSKHVYRVFNQVLIWKLYQLINIFDFFVNVCSMDHSSSIVDFHNKICKSFPGDNK